MNNGLSGIKNIIWALAIVIALLALLVGLIFSVAARNYSDAPDGTLVLSSGSQAVDSRGSGLYLPHDCLRLPGYGRGGAGFRHTAGLQC